MISYSDSRVRGRVCTFLKSKYKTLESAEEAYHLTLSDCLAELTVAGPKPKRQSAANICTHKETTSPADGNQLDTSVCSLSSEDQVLEVLSTLDDEKLKYVADASFLKLALRVGIDTNPGNFATLSVKAMKQLQNQRKNNLLYKFAFCIATPRPGSEEALFPLKRMPFGLVEYQIEFFSSTNITQVSYLHTITILYYLFKVLFTVKLKKDVCLQAEWAYQAGPQLQFPWYEVSRSTCIATSPWMGC